MKSGLRMAGRMISYYLVAMVVSLLFLLMMGEQLWLQIALNVLLLAGYTMLLFSDGGLHGEKEATLLVTLQRQREEGRKIDPKQVQQCFSKKSAPIGYVLGVLPLLLLAVLNLIVEPYYPAYVPTQIEEEGLAYIDGVTDEIAAGMPAEGTDAPVEPEASEPEAPAEPETPAEPEEMGPINWVNVIARVAFTPYVAFYGLLQDKPHILNLLFLLFAVLLPLAEPVGYLRGPKLREKKLQMIAKGKKRKMRNLRVNKKPKQGPRPPKMEV